MCRDDLTTPGMAIASWPSFKPSKFVNVQQPVFLKNLAESLESLDNSRNFSIILDMSLALSLSSRCPVCITEWALDIPAGNVGIARLGGSFLCGYVDCAAAPSRKCCSEQYVQILRFWSSLVISIPLQMARQTSRIHPSYDFLPKARRRKPARVFCNGGGVSQISHGIRRL
jgi:hypothetical protein